MIPAGIKHYVPKEKQVFGENSVTDLLRKYFKERYVYDGPQIVQDLANVLMNHFQVLIDKNDLEGAVNSLAENGEIKLTVRWLGTYKLSIDM